MTEQKDKTSIIPTLPDFPEPAAEQKVFILDHNTSRFLKYQDDYTKYSYDTRVFNKILPGAYVLQRRTGKSAKDRKFTFYGGGYVDNIAKTEEEGRIMLSITHPFRFEFSLKQGDRLLENITFEKKAKTDNWNHFFSQCGITEITLNDFRKITELVTCIPVEKAFDLEQSEPDYPYPDTVNAIRKKIGKNYYLGIYDGEHKETCCLENLSAKLDWNTVKGSDDMKQTLAKRIILAYLNDKTETDNLPKPVLLTDYESVCNGYDIKAWNTDGKEQHIKVKATAKENYYDRFPMADTEIEASQYDDYKLYRLYEMKDNSDRCSIMIYKGPITSQKFRLEPKEYMVYAK